MTRQEQEKLEIALLNCFSINEADAINRVITDTESSVDRLKELLTIIDKRDEDDGEGYDELIDSF